MEHIFANDKIMVVLAVALIAICAIFALSDGVAEKVALSSISALAGFVTGQVFKKDVNPEEKKGE